MVIGYVVPWMKDIDPEVPPSPSPAATGLYILRTGGKLMHLLK